MYKRQITYLSKFGLRPSVSIPIAFRLGLRFKKTIQWMKELLDKYPLTDPEDETKDDVVEGLRSKFRAVCATLGVKLKYNGYPNKSEPQEIDF